MTLNISRVAADKVPAARSRLGAKWEALHSQLLAAHAAGEAISVQPLTSNDAGNFTTAMRKRGIKVRQRKVNADTFVFLVESIRKDGQA